MEKLSNFIEQINEEEIIKKRGRGRPRKVRPDDEQLELDNQKLELDKVEGKPAEKNGTKGAWAVDEPTDDELMEGLDPDEISENTQQLQGKFAAEEPFFIQGKAGWGKSSIIKRMAKTFGYKVVVIYLDKKEAVDLGGMPIPKQKGDDISLETEMPDWAKNMWNHPEQNFLLFFDEMNQAMPDVLNALMPIVLDNEICGEKFNNFFVGAAGNYHSENDALADLPGPLVSRFKPLIVWSTDHKAWMESAHYNHVKWDRHGMKKLLTVIFDNKDIFDNPREIEHKIIQWIYRIKNPQTEAQKKAQKNVIKIDYFVKRLRGLINDEARKDPQNENTLTEIAQEMYDYCTEQEETRMRGSKAKDITMIPKDTVETIKYVMDNGFIVQTDKDGKSQRIGFSRENIFDQMNYEEDGTNRDMIERLIKTLENDGHKWKYETNKQFLEDNPPCINPKDFKNPNEK